MTSARDIGVLRDFTYHILLEIAGPGERRAEILYLGCMQGVCVTANPGCNHVRTTVRPQDMYGTRPVTSRMFHDIMLDAAIIVNEIRAWSCRGSLPLFPSSAVCMNCGL